MKASDESQLYRGTFLQRVWRDFSFIAQKRTLLSPPTKPIFDKETMALFNDLITAPETKAYLEFGAGGATLLAAQHVEFLISVESDRLYRDLVRSSVEALETGAETHLLHGDFGITAGWGKPLFKLNGYSFSGKNYVNAPWALIEQKQRKIDFVLVDGRYRAACACKALMSPSASNAVILLDDFSDRPEYHGVLDFADVLERPGRSVLLRRKSDFDAEACEKFLQKHLYCYM